MSDTNGGHDRVGFSKRLRACRRRAGNLYARCGNRSPLPASPRLISFFLRGFFFEGFFFEAFFLLLARLCFARGGDEVAVWASSVVRCGAGDGGGPAGNGNGGASFAGGKKLERASR